MKKNPYPWYQFYKDPVVKEQAVKTWQEGKEFVWRHKKPIAAATAVGLGIMGVGLKRWAQRRLERYINQARIEVVAVYERYKVNKVVTMFALETLGVEIKIYGLRALKQFDKENNPFLTQAIKKGAEEGALLDAFAELAGLPVTVRDVSKILQDKGILPIR